MIIAVDFDGTIVTHNYPHIGECVGAIPWLKKFQEAGAELVLWTMRCDSERHGPVLTDAVEFCDRHGVRFFGVNSNPSQGSWTRSPKAYANIYIDDAAFGCPLVYPAGGRPHVDWEIVGPAVLKMIRGE